MRAIDKAIIYISYHPSSLTKYTQMQKVYNSRYYSVLIICKHPYMNQDIIECYKNIFNELIFLPDIQYEINIFRLISKVAKFLETFNLQIKPILKNIKSFSVVSNASSYLPVNAILSRLRRHKKCRYSISIACDLFYKVEIDILKTVYVLFASFILRIYPIYYNRKLSFMYIKYPIDRILRLDSPFSQKNAFLPSQIKSIPVYNVLELFAKRSASKKDMIIFYGDMTVFDAYGSDLSGKEYKERLALFFSFLSKYYSGCELNYKPHPLDEQKTMTGLDNIHFKLYKGGLTSQLHLDMNIDRVKACYSIASTSLKYSASQGIPSYACYKYFQFNNEYPKYFFENEDASGNPFLYNIEKIEQIGRVDNIEVDTVKSSPFDDWYKVMQP